MKEKLFLKKLAELGDGARAKLEKFFGGAINSGKEMVEKFRTMSAKTRVKVMKQVGAGLLSILVLAGFTGCVNDKGEIDDTKTSTQVTLVTPEDILGATTTPAPKPQPGTSAVTGAGTNAPQTTPVTPGITTTPVVPGTTTAAPSTTTTTPGSTPVVPGPTTETPGSTPVVPGSTTAPETTETPGVTPPAPAEDLPADADGYAYPKFFSDLVTERVVGQRLLSDSVYYERICNADPEILFVERGVSTADELCPIIIYVRYDIDGKNLYARFAFGIKNRAHTYLNAPSLYSSYAGYVDAIKTALEDRSNNLSADVSELEYKTDEINAGLTKTFAKFIDDRFVDAEINCVRVVYDGMNPIYELSGFGYDSEGKSYSFISNIDLSVPYSCENVILDICSGRLIKSDMVSCDITTKAIDSVFTREAQSEQ